MISVAVLFGGNSTEHIISIKTGKFIYNTLDRTKYRVKPIYIDRSGLWYVPEGFDLSIPAFNNTIDNINSFEKEFIDTLSPTVHKFPPDNFGCEIFFLGLHGGSGEDGTIQSLLHSLGIVHSGSGSLASGIAMNKLQANKIFQSAGLHVAPFQTISRWEFAKDPLGFFHLDFPVFVKPNQGGSSVGAGIAKSKEELLDRLKSVFALESTAIIQKLISGMEVSCGVIEFPVNGIFEPRALFPTEIVHDTEFFDFSAKYTVGKSQEITPARLKSEVLNQVREFALLAHKELGCSGYSRTDFIIENDIPYVLETNTLPGMTETSLIPQQVAYEKMDMKFILDILIQNALSKNL